MYNNIGIATPRGSGTSGYIQRNYGHVRSKLKGRDEFLKELKALKVIKKIVSILNIKIHSI